MSIATPGQVIQNLVILNQQGLEFEHYEKLHAGYLAALAQSTKRGKLPELSVFRKAIGLGLLTPVTQRIMLPADTAFVVGTRFLEDKTAEVPISFLGHSWRQLFSHMEVPATDTCDVQVDELTKDASGKDIVSEAGEDVCETSPAIIWLMMKYGHLSKDKRYLFCMKDADGAPRVVYVTWNDGGWVVDAYPILPSREWGAGIHVVSRKRLAALV